MLRTIALMLIIATAPAMAQKHLPAQDSCNGSWPVPKNFAEVEKRLAQCPMSASTYAVVNRCPPNKIGRIPATVMCDRQLQDHLNGGDNH